MGSTPGSIWPPAVAPCALAQPKPLWFPWFPGGLAPSASGRFKKLLLEHLRWSPASGPCGKVTPQRLSQTSQMPPRAPCQPGLAPCPISIKQGAVSPTQPGGYLFTAVPGASSLPGTQLVLNKYPCGPQHPHRYHRCSLPAGKADPKCSPSKCLWRERDNII